MSKAKLPKEIQISAYINEFLIEYAEAVKNGYEIVPSFYSPLVTPTGLIMVNMELH